MFQPIIQENFLDSYYFEYLDNWVHSFDIEWRFNNNISGKSDFKQTENDLWKIGCAKGLHWPEKNEAFHTTGSEHLIPAILKMEDTFVKTPRSCFRARLDMTFKSLGIRHDPHTDYNLPHWTAILYFSDTDGETIIYNERRDGVKYHQPSLENDVGLTELVRITSKKNKIVFFDGLHYHTGHSPTKTSNRIVLNANFNCNDTWRR